MLEYCLWQNTIYLFRSYAKDKKANEIKGNKNKIS